MQIREYTPADVDALRAIHAAQGFDYVPPDLSNPLFVTKIVIVNGSEGLNVAPGFNPASRLDSPTAQPPATLKGGATLTSHGAIVGAALLRLTAEAYLLLDPRAGTPRQRWQWLLALHEAARRDAWLRGLEDVHAWLPPPIARKFGRRLERLGWIRDDAWTPYCRKL
jgi:hypothetical protein